MATQAAWVRRQWFPDDYHGGYVLAYTTSVAHVLDAICYWLEVEPMPDGERVAGIRECLRMLSEPLD